MPLAASGSQGLYTTYSLIVLATFLGTMGLPHVVVRFYTNPDGRAARRTTLVVLGAARRLLPAAAGLRRARPGLRADLATARRHRSCSSCRRLMVGGLGGDLLTGLVTAGAFAAFLSTSSGLTIAVRACSRQDVLQRPALGRHGVPASPPSSRSSYRWPPPLLAPDLSASPARSGWPSRWPRRRSARCWCSASGGAASPPPARSPACSSAALGSAPRVAWTPVTDGAPAAGSTPCSASPPRGRVPLAFAHDGRRLAAHPAPRARPRRAGSWSGCTPPRPSPLDRG